MGLNESFLQTAASGDDPIDNFNSVLYTGDSPATQDVNTVGFQPDMVWVKAIDDTTNHILSDSIRGVCESLSPNTTADEVDMSPNGISAFNADGFDVLAPTGGGQGVNENGTEYIGWSWKAGGAPSTPNTGGVSPTLGSKMVDGVADTSNFATVTNGYPTMQTINTTLDFSITQYTKTTGSSNAEIPHGLSGAPDFVILRFISPGYADYWQIYNSRSGTGNYLQLQDTAAVTTRANSFSTVNSDYVANHWTSVGLPIIMYSFKSKAGFSKIDYFAGTSATLPITGLGFAPRFVMIKAITTTGPWVMQDKTMNPSNPAVNHLRANSNSGENSGAGEQIDFDSNGFTINYNACGNINCSGDDFLYVAFA